MLKFFQDWNTRRLIRQSQISEADWREAVSRLPILNQLDIDEHMRLLALASLFLKKKAIDCTQGLELNDSQRLLIALQACLLILKLDFTWFDGWYALIVYPDRFYSPQERTDEFGLVHQNKRALSGEAWLQGPVILSWSDIEKNCILDGSNLIIHELAHKLDMCNGKANGMPPLHDNIAQDNWTQVFSKAYEDFQWRVQDGETGGIDSYAAYSPAEFFAVLSEVFFETPERLRNLYPKAYQLLCRFYRINRLA
ncbi:MAG: M90 family metallopeptidase [Pseudomonadota bacterium]